ncbi:uncharacterized protein LACBIDRAFT_336119 [Laccaria bicolor S238N-H82]|uniref:Predicted protein n=1 Tax=Laccaria bicolor (strain S238N-H82 / ATCC MYA-4686) TaxID=486041 RepID=B0E131_LACBS|nr:uncharacterized protein LACBIDRAFT_335015 [Laccaria bicolor S238N-H82]XP_001891079.1 uncharacterized protein LACBIDRAFT_336119 [Laccaria bicolor S238N-H82]EDQ98268.1 predicted protein [Laccaria bicolor S238N-H82]EDQ99442.1 predicted protein [Laccaria bicolor S238N-H82]|eukprot:XP_001889897.1 predicted protein [Laccaria bicolor S238N-H82]
MSDNGSDDNNDQGIWQRGSPSPALSVSHLAARFAQRKDTFVGGTAPRSPMQSDAELERKRRGNATVVIERQKLYSREAQCRRLGEDCGLAMIERRSHHHHSDLTYLTHPPRLIRGKSQVATNRWSAAESRLTPTKDPLTPAQQIILDTMARDKDNKQNVKGKEKEWPKADSRSSQHSNNSHPTRPRTFSFHVFA